MKKIKVSDASPTVLNHLVAKLEGHEWRCPWMLKESGLVQWQSYEAAWGNPTPDYCDNWSDMGEVIDRTGMAVGRCWNDGQQRTNPYDAAYAYLPFVGGECVGIKEYGASPLIAAARCYVVSRMGNVVEVPDELFVDSGDAE